MLEFICDVHPVFDPAAQEWVAEWDGREFTAPCLNELQRMLPPDVGIYGYYPDGYCAQQPEPDAEIPALRSFRRDCAPSVHPVGKRHHRRVTIARAVKAKEVAAVDVPIAPEPVLEPVPAPVQQIVSDSIPAGLGSQEGILEEGVVAEVTPSRPRKKYAPRRWFGANRRWTADELQILQDMLKKGMATGWIAMELGRTRNSIIGCCHRHKYQLNGVRW